jgi:hypothetical protein
MACMNFWTGSKGFHVPFLYCFEVFLFAGLVILVEGLDPTFCLRTLACDCLVQKVCRSFFVSWYGVFGVERCQLHRVKKFSPSLVKFAGSPEGFH